jgi:hypothetical protein
MIVTDEEKRGKEAAIILISPLSHHVLGGVE